MRVYRRAGVFPLNLWLPPLGEKSSGLNLQWKQDHKPPPASPNMTKPTRICIQIFMLSNLGEVPAGRRGCHFPSSHIYRSIGITIGVKTYPFTYGLTS